MAKCIILPGTGQPYEATINNFPADVNPLLGLAPGVLTEGNALMGGTKDMRLCLFGDDLVPMDVPTNKVVSALIKYFFSESELTDPTPFNPRGTFLLLNEKDPATYDMNDRCDAEHGGPNYLKDVSWADIKTYIAHVKEHGFPADNTKNDPLIYTVIGPKSANAPPAPAPAPAPTAGPTIGRNCSHCKLIVPKVQFMYCSKCRVVGYCSKQCQKAAWQDHKRYCKISSNVKSPLICKHLQTIVTNLITTSFKPCLVAMMTQNHMQDCAAVMVSWTGPGDISTPALKVAVMRSILLNTHHMGRCVHGYSIDSVHSDEYSDEQLLGWCEVRIMTSQESTRVINGIRASLGGPQISLIAQPASGKRSVRVITASMLNPNDFDMHVRVAIMPK